MEGEWGPWIEYRGEGRPVPETFWVEVVGVGVSWPRQIVDQDFAGVFAGWDWSRFGQETGDDEGSLWGKIIRYRVRKPRALLDLIDLVENLPAPASPKVPA